MPAPVLRHYNSVPGATITDVTIVPAIPAARALVISKITVANYSATTTSQFDLYVGGQGIAFFVNLAPGEVYTESGLTVITGETVVWRQRVASSLACHVFGQEVDN